MGATEALLLDPLPFEVFLAVRADGLSGSGTCEDPWSAGTQEKFDEIMRGFSEPGANTNVVIHLAPGVYETRGYSDDDVYASWEMRPGMKLLGSGMSTTVLKVLTGPATQYSQTFAVGHQLAID